MSNSKSILELRDLSIGYQTSASKTVIAQNINLDLSEGQLIALIGTNGIGKSTLLKTILTFEKPLQGTVKLYGKNISTYSQKQLSEHISVVLTEKLPPSNLSVYELVALGRQPYTNWLGELSAEDQQKVEDALTLVNITELASKKYFQLSDGQFQKVMIARALAQDTPIIILDEPTTHLDLLHKVSVFKLLKKLASTTGKCVLFSTHDIELALEFCDEIIVMTSHQTLKDSPKNLIENEILDQIFENESVRFDKENRKFIFD